MLEFQKDFFEQEIRDGFYIDSTMKTVWVAELELLQKVAEICDRHGIAWFAAYGTLLGAVRHEGFIPWDDDMDIWVRRKGYNRLLQLLPLELPVGSIHRGQYDGEDPAEQERSFREEIWEDYLERCGAKIDHRLVELEEWLCVASEFGR